MTLEQRISEAAQRLREATVQYAPAAFSSSFGAEDMVVHDLIARESLAVEIFTLDTGRLHDETLALVHRARLHYGIPVRVLYPDAADLDAFVTRHGPNAFYDSVALRKQCCGLRKLEPLSRALAGKGLWITGLRRSQSVTREELDVLSHDAARGLAKLNPIVDWTAEDVQAYLRRFDVPVNPLHARGFPSIGCAPCTRAVAPHEHERAGRWWWEQPESRECGLHVNSEGRLVRAAEATTVREAT
ncbi:MAG: phosphoadenylyl-sulfate reductase [Betaproteobacteria bacterium]|nr:phosphoadenylyl-sulfate reductase [Betaproteobacteria bacterium]